MAQTDSNKTQLRQTLKARRNALTPASRIAASASLVHQLRGLPNLDQQQHVAGYWAFQGELALNQVITHLFSHGQTFYLPVITGPRLIFAAWSAGATVSANKYGIPEPRQPYAIRAPEALDLVLVPLLGFDRKGTRLGYGGGFYDRTFEFCASMPQADRPLLVGVAYAVQECPHLEAESWDVPLDYIATEKALIHCTP